MATNILHKRRSGSDIVAGDLTAGEIGLRIDNGSEKAYFRGTNNLIELAKTTDIGEHTVTLTGDITGSATTSSGTATVTTTLADDSVTYAKIQNVVGDGVLLGNIGGVGGIVAELSDTQIRTLLNIEDGATADQSATEILTAIKTVDGDGSGLDADLLDGLDSTAFQPVDTGLTQISGLTPTNGNFIVGNDTNNGWVTESGDTARLSLGLGTTDSPTFDGLTLSGDLTVNGTTTTINTTTLEVEDKNIECGKVTTPSDITASGGGITLKGDSDKTITWLASPDRWVSSEDLDLLTGNEVYRINGSEVLSATALGSNVTSSNLESVGLVTSGTIDGGLLT